MGKTGHFTFKNFIEWFYTPVFVKTGKLKETGYRKFAFKYDLMDSIEEALETNTPK